MKLVLYGTSADKELLVRTLAVLPDRSYRRITIFDYADYDSFISGLGGSFPDCIVVSVNGADGMEGVIAARDTCRNVPILWFSDDAGFGAQSYRLGCAYFHVKPVPPQLMSAAIAKWI